MLYQYIAGQTPLDEEEKRGLIPSLITRADLDKWEQENIIAARSWLINKRILSKQDIFSDNFLISLHKRMFAQVWKWAGKFRKTNKNIGIEFYQIPIELRLLLDDAKFWQENSTYSLPDLAVIFHHRLVKIHLFANGNGRHARLAADAIIIKNACKPLSWGGNSDLNKPDEIRKNYIAALKKADGGDYTDLIEFANS